MKITHKDGNFEGKNGTKIYYQLWKPDKVKDAMIISHGYAEYSGRYPHVGDHFANEGIAVYALDHRGHGLSEGHRGHIDSFDDYLADLDTFFGIVKGMEKGKKIFLLGHSMGGTIAIAYALKQPKKMNGLILSSPWLKTASPPDPELVKQIVALSQSNPTQDLPAPVEPKNISHDPVVVNAYDKDPMVFRTLTARFIVEIFTACENDIKNAGKLVVPTLHMYAGADKVVDPDGSKEFAKGVKEKDYKVIVFPDFYHELFNEVEKQKVFDAVDTWLKPRL
ncbi:MAG: lysophospholipase [Candidatus Freyarchaeum deiterrae]